MVHGSCFLSVAKNGHTTSFECFVLSINYYMQKYLVINVNFDLQTVKSKVMQSRVQAFSSEIPEFHNLNKKVR